MQVYVVCCVVLDGWIDRKWIDERLLCYFLFLVDLDDPYGTLVKQRSTEIGEGRLTPTASSGMSIV